MSKPVVAYIAGFTAPAGKRWATPARSSPARSGTAAAKVEALEAKGVRVGRTPTEVADIAVEVLGGAPAAPERAVHGRAARASPPAHAPYA